MFPQHLRNITVVEIVQAVEHDVWGERHNVVFLLSGYKGDSRRVVALRLVGGNVAKEDAAYRHERGVIEDVCVLWQQCTRVGHHDLFNEHTVNGLHVDRDGLIGSFMQCFALV